MCKRAIYIRKEPCISAKEPCISAKEPCISGKEPYISINMQGLPSVPLPTTFVAVCVKEPCISSKEPYTSAKQTFASAKEPPHINEHAGVWKRALYIRKRILNTCKKALCANHSS